MGQCVVGLCKLNTKRSMNMGETGGNYLCPCGSGKMYKQCCLGKEAPAGMESLTKALLNEIKEEVEKRHFSSTDELNIFIRDFMQGANQESNEDFYGLFTRTDASDA